MYMYICVYVYVYVYTYMHIITRGHSATPHACLATFLIVDVDLASTCADDILVLS